MCFDLTGLPMNVQQEFTIIHFCRAPHTPRQAEMPSGDDVAQGMSMVDDVRAACGTEVLRPLRRQQTSRGLRCAHPPSDSVVSVSGNS
jgi:hypothetical protein